MKAPLVCKLVVLQLTALLCGALPAFAQTKPFVHQLFSNNMVLQRDTVDPVWGWTTPGAAVSVTINGQTVNATADANGRWEADVGPFPANSSGYTLQVTGPQSKTFTNVLVGDVFLCSGQSNMAFNLSGVINSAAEIADAANYPNIRCFSVPTINSLTPQDNLTNGSWNPAGSGSTAGFTAVGYFMAREMYKHNPAIPIGIVAAPWSGSVIESWINRPTSEGIADFTQKLYDQDAIGIGSDGTVAGDANPVTGHYNGLIYPLASFKFKAAVWYQGESNQGRGEQYQRMLPLMLSNWRALFGANLPFVIVQIVTQSGTNTGFADIREADEKVVAADPTRTRFVTTLDLGTSDFNLHPPDKQDVGQRVSWAMRNLIYSENIAYQPPTLSSSTVNGGSITCTFANVGSGLMVGTKDSLTPLSPVQEVVGGTVNGFIIAGADHVFKPATATITGTNTVSVSSTAVASPLYVRYAWADHSDANLYAKITDANGNANGLPVSSCRNDPTWKLSANFASGGVVDYSQGLQHTLTATVPSGMVFHHWSGDTTLLSGSGSSVTATVSQRYVSVRAEFQITSTPVFTVSAEVGRNAINWVPFTATGIHYNIKRATSSGGPFTNIAANLISKSHYEDTNVADGVTYYYTVVGVNEIGEGPLGTPVPATTIPLVRGVQAVSGPASVALSWQAFTGAVSYNIGRSTVQGGPYEIIATGLTGLGFTDHSVVAGKNYYYVVSAQTSSGTTPASIEVSVTPNFLPSPLDSRDIGTVGLTGSATVTGSNQLTVLGAGADISSGATDNFRFVYGTLTGDGSITARVASITNTSIYAKGGVMMRATLDTGSPYAMALRWGNQTGTAGLFRLAADASAYTLTGGPNGNFWLRVTRAGNVFTSYTSPDGGTWTQLGSPQTIVMPSTIYTGLAVCAHSNTTLNTTVFDNISINGSPLPSAQAPQTLTADVRASDGNVLLHWNASVATGSYNVKQSTASGGPFTTIASVTDATQYAPTGLTAGTRYYYAVSAVTGMGESTNSNIATIDVPALNGTPPAPSSVKALPGSGQVTLSWSGPATATNFTVLRSTQAGGTYSTVGTFSTSQAVDSSPANGTTYYYTVVANGPSGSSQPSAPVACTPRYPSTFGSIRANSNNRYVSAVGANALIPNQAYPTSTEIFELLDLGGGQSALRAFAGGGYVSVQSPGNNQLYAIASSIGATERFSVLNYTDGTFSLQSQANTYYVTAPNTGTQPLVANRTSAGSWEKYYFSADPSLKKSTTGLNAFAGDGQVSLSWNAMTDAINYVVARSTTAGGPYTQVAQVTGTTFTDTGLTDGTTYYYVVSALSNSVTGPNSDTVGATPQAPAGTLNRTGWLFTASVSGGGNPPSNAGDGNIATRWSTGGAQAPGQWFQADMGSVNTITKLVLDQGASSGDWPRGYQVNVSEDGVNWGYPVATGVGTVNVTTITLAAPQTVRYIRITQTGSTTGTYWSIHEFQVYGTPVQVLDRTGWVASGSINAAPSNAVGNAIDGNTGTRWSTVGAQANGQWFQVDMGSLHAFSQVVMDCGPWPGDWPRGYQIYVSNNGASWGSPVATGAGASTITAVSFPEQIARYIRVVQTGSTTGTYWSIGEFNVTGTPVSSPGAPNSVTVASGYGQASLSWAAVSGATTYTIKRSTTSGGPYAVVASNILGTSFTDTGLTNGVTYYYVVSAVNNSGTSINSAEASIAVGSLPSPWQTTDIGSVGVTGSAFYDGTSVFTVAGSGADIAGTTDSFRYVYQAASGDCSIVANVTSQQNTNSWAKAGVMIRETTAAGAANAAVLASNGAVNFQWRSATGSSTQSASGGWTSPTQWVKVTRIGNSFSAFRSSDGVNWIVIGTPQTITMASSSLMGLAVTAHNNTVTSTVTFDHVTATP
ncbi:MAG TPA: discoidin domain-containing protein [Rariglobus sp.]|jgi:sialate O-acetylesterase|nr:discoidin domain-containing protein [Rariglobus sp.]